MELSLAVEQLAALAQEARLLIYRRLVRAGSGGLCPGELAAELGLTPSVLSFHLKTLAAAGLVRMQRDGRHRYYHADFAAMNGLLGYLSENCCADRPLEHCETPQKCITS
jgi:DNA-binding transcriptional ArsR family regulator